MPAARVFYCFILTTLLVVVGVLVPWIAWAALGLDVLILAAFFVDLRQVRTVEVTAERRWPPLLVQGAPADVELELQTPSSNALVVRLREALHPAVASSPQRTEVELRSGEGLGWTYRIHPRRRGDHEVGPLTARVLGPWRLAWHEREVLAPERRKVYPQVRWDGKVGHLLLLAHRHALGGNPQRLQGVGREPYGVREYLPGDPTSKIHWKATARHGRLVTREETWERGARLVVLLDCARTMSGQDGQRSKLDHALAAALALTRVAVSRGDRVTFLAFSDQVERTVRIHGGHRGLHTAYGSLYDLEARSAEPAFDVAAEMASQVESRRSTAVLFTSVVDLAAAELLREAVLKLERRHRPILINLEDPELVALAEDPPETEEDVFAQVAALQILLANRQLGKRLRRAGVRVVQASADRLALETLEAYLAMFH